MNSNDVQNQSEQLTAVPATQSAEPSARRRLLLKGALSAPVIMTLYSGAALARSSNWITTTDQAGDGTPSDLDSSTTETNNDGTKSGYACAIDGGTNVDSDKPCDSTDFTGSIGEKCDLGDSGELFSADDKFDCQTTNDGLLVYASHACSSFSDIGITKTNLDCTNY